MMTQVPCSFSFLFFLGDGFSSQSQKTKRHRQSENRKNINCLKLAHILYIHCKACMSQLIQLQFIASLPVVFWTFSIKSVTCSTKGCQQRMEHSSRRMCRENTGVCGVFRVMAEDGGLFCPLHSGVLQQVMHTELSLPVQNCWYPEEAMRQAADEAQDLR